MKGTKQQKDTSAETAAVSNSGTSVTADSETAQIVITSKAATGSISIASELPFKGDNGEVWQYSESLEPGTITEVSVNCHNSAGATIANDNNGNSVVTIPITDNNSQVLINFTRPTNPEQQLTPIIVKGGDDGSSSSLQTKSGDLSAIPNVFIVSGIPFTTPLQPGEGDHWHDAICQTPGYMTQVTVTLPETVTVTIANDSDFYVDVPVESGDVSIDITYNYISDGTTAKS